MNGLGQPRQTFRSFFPGPTSFIIENTYPPGHPYAHPVIGSMEDLEAASLQAVYDWFRTYYRAANAVIVIAADIGSETALERVDHYLGEHRAWAATTRTSQRFESCGFVPPPPSQSTARAVRLTVVTRK